MRAEEKDHRLHGRKVATATLSHAKIQGTIGNDIQNSEISQWLICREDV